jgi:4-hydroxy-tetrahydrodipicolinate synthase
LQLSGSLCALVTPFADDGRLDLRGFAALVDRQLAGGSAGVVVAGSTGEAAMLDGDEFVALLECASERLSGRLPVLAGTGTAATARTVAQTRLAAMHGADAALVVTPYYVRPTQEGLYRHFLAVAEDGDLPLVLYNVPGRTGCDLKPDTVARLCGHPRIVGIKEADPDPTRMQALLPLQTPHFSVLSGDDPTMMRAQLAGARGVISVAANVAPRALQAICAACADGDAARAGSLDSRLAPLYAFLGVESNPIPVKWLASELFGDFGPQLRLPLTPLSAHHHAAGRALVDRLQSDPELS